MAIEYRLYDEKLGIGFLKATNGNTRNNVVFVYRNIGLSNYVFYALCCDPDFYKRPLLTLEGLLLIVAKGTEKLEPASTKQIGILKRELKECVLHLLFEQK